MATNFEDDTLTLLYDVARLMRLRGDQRARQRGMTRAQWVILFWVDRQPGICQNELASLVEVEPITIARLVDRLEARGFIERRPDPKDRRLRRLHLTLAAEPLLAEIKSYKQDLAGLIRAGIDDDALKSLAEALLRMKTNLLALTRDIAKVV